MEVWRSKIHSINESVCPGAGHLSSFFARGRGIATLFLPDPGNCQLKEKKSANARGLPGGGWAMLELTDALHVSVTARKLICADNNYPG
jgi:hypothetical protein